jgi:hypothetical protein
MRPSCDTRSKSELFLCISYKSSRKRPDIIKIQKGYLDSVDAETMNISKQEKAEAGGVWCQLPNLYLNKTEFDIELSLCFGQKTS